MEIQAVSRARRFRTTQQVEQSTLFEIEARIASSDDAQMPWPEIVDRAPVEVLVDDNRADVRRTRNRGRISEAFNVLAHRLSQVRQALGKAHELVEFLLLLPRAEFGR